MVNHGFQRLALSAVFALTCAGLLCGCIADTAADSDLPWATNQSWEGMMPLPGGFGYD